MIGRYNEAIELLLRGERICQKYGTKDASVEFYRSLAEYQQRLGKKNLALQYQSHYFALKDTLLNLQQFANIKEMSFAGSLRRVNEQMEQGRRERQVMTTTIIVLLIIALVISLSLYILYRKNRQLRASYSNLYQKNQEVLRLEEEYKKPQLEENTSSRGSASQTSRRCMTRYNRFLPTPRKYLTRISPSKDWPTSQRLPTKGIASHQRKGWLQLQQLDQRVSCQGGL